MAEDAPLRLQARDEEDLAVMSAVVQDALVPLGDIAHLSDEGCFVMALNRFRWERAVRAAGEGERHERVHAGLRFDEVEAVQYRNIDLHDRGRFLSLLHLAYQEGEDGPVVLIRFADDAAIRLRVRRLNCVLGDLSEPWPTVWTPDHGEG